MTSVTLEILVTEMKTTETYRAQCFVDGRLLGEAYREDELEARQAAQEEAGDVAAGNNWSIAGVKEIYQYPKTNSDKI